MARSIESLCRQAEDKKLNDYLRSLDEQDVCEEEEEETPSYNEDEEDR